MTKLSELKPSAQVAAEEKLDPAVAEELNRTTIANQLAIMVIQYRVDHDLSQSALGRILGMHQPAVARLEAGDHEPTVATLERLSSALGLDLHLHLNKGMAVLLSA
jgi:ribosome-binding protein aMBF1 (putative translation factor)